MNGDGPTSSRGFVALAGGVFAVSVAALVILELNGRSTTNLMALVAPVVAALFIARRIDHVTTAQNKAIEKIDQQTNGVLDERIKTQTKAALREAGIIGEDAGSRIPD